MIHRDSDHIYTLVFDALRKTGNRAIILSAWSSLSRSRTVELFTEHSTSVFLTEAVPHDWLLPRCKAILHHGGAGTTAASLLHGIPTIIVPFAAYQPFWVARIHTVGAGPLPIPVKKLTAE